MPRPPPLPTRALLCVSRSYLLLMPVWWQRLPLHSRSLPLRFPSLLSLRPCAGARASARQPWPPRPNSLAAAAPSPEASCSRTQQRASRERLPTPSSGQQGAGKHRRRSNSRSSHLSPWPGHYGLPRARLSSPTRAHRLPGAPPPLPRRRHGPQRPEPRAPTVSPALIRVRGCVQQLEETKGPFCEAMTHSNSAPKDLFAVV